MKTEQKKLKALERIKCMLDQLDHNVEMMLASDREKLWALLLDLKGASLSKYEQIVIEQMLGSKN